MKRKLEEDFQDDRKVSSPSSHDDDAHQDLAPEVRTQVEILESTFSSTESDRASAKRAIHVLSELAKNGNSTSRFIFISSGSEYFMYISVYLELIQLNSEVKLHWIYSIFFLKK